MIALVAATLLVAAFLQAFLQPVASRAAIAKRAP